MRLTGLDGLRAISILMVIAYHLDEGRFPHGEFGVNVFFVLSGFLITHLLCVEEERAGRISISSFYLRRAFRILPPAWTYLLAVIPLVGVGATLPAVLFVANFTGHNVSVGHYWTLSVEEQFYLAWPTLFWILRSNRNRLLLVAATLVVGFFWPDVVLKFGIPRRGLIATSLILLVGHYPILIGCCLALAARLRRLPRAAWWMPLLGLAWILAGFTGRLPASAATLLPFGVVPILHWAVSRHSLLDSPPLTWIGKVSYSLYLWQQLFCFKSPLAVLGRFPYNVLASFAMAAFSYYCIEQPALRIRDRVAGGSVSRSKRNKSMVAAAAGRE
jgi:peptidoglycan/LPS O-acetylase OafA/YrhL